MGDGMMERALRSHTGEKEAKMIILDGGVVGWLTPGQSISLQVAREQKGVPNAIHTLVITTRVRIVIVVQIMINLPSNPPFRRHPA